MFKEMWAEFKVRMTTETHSPTPRWLYLLLKPVETIAIAAGLVGLTHLPTMPVAWGVVAFYVGLGLYLWYKGGIKRWTGKGGFLPDLIYHLLPSLPAVVVMSENAPLGGKWLIIGGLVLIWWVLDLLGYGPMRSVPE